MERLFDNSSGYTTFTKVGHEKVILFQKFFMDQIKKCQKEDVDPNDISKLLKMFLNDKAFKQLTK